MPTLSSSAGVDAQDALEVFTDAPVGRRRTRREETKGTLPTLAVVGNGPVSWKLCEQLADRGGLSRYRVVVFGEEPRPAYDRVNLSRWFEHRDDARMELAPRSWYDGHGIDLHTGDPVVSLDPEQRRLVTRAGREETYDKVVLATGSRAFVPPIPGADGPGVFVYRTLKDVGALAERTEALIEERGRGGQRATVHAAVLGGGLLGLEAAKVLLDLGANPHVFEAASVLMPRQLDTEAAGLLRREVEGRGVTVHTTTRVGSLEQEGHRVALCRESEPPMLFDLIVVAAGVRPRDELARQAGIDVGPRGGVLVDDRLRTSNPNVLAIGECACHRDTVYGLIGPGYQMAAVAVDQLLRRIGRATRFYRGDVSTSLKLLGVDVVTVGDYLQEHSETRVLVGGHNEDAGEPEASAPGAIDVASSPDSESNSNAPAEESEFAPDHTLRGLTPSARREGEEPEEGPAGGPAHETYTKLILAKNRLVGAVSVGPNPEVARLREAVDVRRRIPLWRQRQFSETGRLWGDEEAGSVADWPESARVCSCLGVTRGDLSKACASGCLTADALAEATGASTVCGSCRPMLAELVGAPSAPVNVPGNRVLAAASGVAMIATLVVWLLPAVEPARSLQSPRFEWTELLRDDFFKQVTGFTLLGLTLMLGALSLRKRWPKVQWLAYGNWRAAHSVIGLLAVVGVVVHTGLDMGRGLNLWLAVSFLGTGFVGAAAGLAAAGESPRPSRLALLARRWKPRLALLHVLCAWPLPVLIFFHVLGFYWSGNESGSLFSLITGGTK